MPNRRCKTERCNQPISGSAQRCYFHNKRAAGLIGAAPEYPVLNAKKRKEIQEYEVLMDPEQIEKIVASGDYSRPRSTRWRLADD